MLALKNIPLKVSPPPAGPHHTVHRLSRKRRRKVPRNISDTGHSPRREGTAPPAQKAKEGTRRGTKNNHEAGPESLTVTAITIAPPGPRVRRPAPQAVRAGNPSPQGASPDTVNTSL
ncbi:uncharacterized protein LOC115528728 [Lynx canadensis]|uniref:uncharacterized protein LOC115528728 n=1 Tax=Lynx canadensis TaxID=61383 RepID=UPI0013C4361F|nr:uncharacterized protein LOC115528728 [Lynx canadensis]